MSGVELPVSGTRIAQCAECETVLPLSEAVQPEDARVWWCGNCGAEYKGVLAPDYALTELRNIRPERITFDSPSIQRVAPEMLAFAERYEATNVHRTEKRNAPRHSLVAVLVAQQVDDRLSPTGSPFQTVCRNLSASGLCLIHEHAIASDLLIVELTVKRGLPIQTLASIVRRRQIGPYHDLGVEFLTKLAVGTDSH